MSDEDAIRQLVADWAQATMDGDVGRVLPLMTEDATFLVPGQEPMRGRATFEAGLRQVLQQCRFDVRAEVRQVEVSGTLAWCMTWMRVGMAPREGGKDAPPRQREGYILTVFRKNADGQWQLARDANLLS